MVEISKFELSRNKHQIVEINAVILQPMIQLWINNEDGYTKTSSHIMTAWKARLRNNRHNIVEHIKWRLKYPKEIMKLFQ